MVESLPATRYLLPAVLLLSRFLPYTNVAEDRLERAELIALRFDDSFKNLLYLMNEKLSQFNELFSSTYQYLIINQTSYSHRPFENNLVEFYNSCTTDKNLKTIQYVFAFDTFITAEEQGKVLLVIQFNFLNSTYEINVRESSTFLLDKSYSQKLLPSEITEFVSSLVKLLIAQINSLDKN